MADVPHASLDKLKVRVIVVGLVMGCIVIVVVLFVFYVKQDLSVGGVLVCFVGVILISMSLWSQISIITDGVKLELLREQIKKTAEAANEVAEHAQQTSAAIEATNHQLAELTQTVFSGDAPKSLRERDIPNPDAAKLVNARAKLHEVIDLK